MKTNASQSSVQNQINANTQGSAYSVGPIADHNHDGVNSNFLPLSSVRGYFPMVTSVPTVAPGKFGKSIALDSTTGIIYYYDFTNKVWQQTAPDASPSAIDFYGDGSDGTHTIDGSSQTISPWLSAGALTRDVYLNNVTITGSGVLRPSGYRIFVRGTLTITSGGQIQENGSAGGTAGAGSPAFGGGGSQNPGGTAGAAGVAVHGAGSVGASNAGAIGRVGAIGPGSGNNNGNAGSGGNGSVASTNSFSITSGANSGAGGAAGGNGSQSGGTAGAAGTGSAPTAPTFGIHKFTDYETFLEPNNYTPTSYSLYTGSAGGAGGAGGGSGNSVTSFFGSSGGGGGGGGAAGGNIVIYAFNLVNDVSGGIQAGGGSGGVGGAGGAGAANTGGAGGGGGGAGGNGGLILVFYTTMSGTGTMTVAGASGGAGGAAGAIGTGTSIVGQAGSIGGTGANGTVLLIQVL